MLTPVVADQSLGYRFGSRLDPAHRAIQLTCRIAFTQENGSIISDR